MFQVSKCFLLCSSVLLLLACGNKPKACFTVSTEVSKVGEPVQFTDCSENAHYYQYTFGDSSTNELGNRVSAVSNAINPQHVFEKPGVYTTELLVSDKNRRRSKTTTRVLTITGIENTDLVGNWVKNRIEVIPDQNGFPSNFDVSETWEFRSDDSVIVDDGRKSEVRYHYTVTEESKINLQSSFSALEYRIISFFAGQMIFQNDLPGGRANHYFNLQ